MTKIDMADNLERWTGLQLGQVHHENKVQRIFGQTMLVRRHGMIINKTDASEC